MATEIGNFLNSIYTAVTTSIPSADVQEESPNEWNGREVLPLGAIDAFQQIPDILIQQTQSVASLVSSFRLPFQQEPPAFDIGKEVRGIKNLPTSIQGIIKSYTNPFDYILEKIKQNEEIPDYLLDLAKNETHLDLSAEAIPTQSQILQILKCCENIKTLKMPECTYQDATPVDVDAYVGFIQKLKLDVSDIINHIATFENLQYLDLSKWTKNEFEQIFTDDVFYNLLSLKNLRYLNLGRCYLLTNETLSRIADNCKDLQHLEIGWTYNFTYVGIEYLSKLANLRYLNLMTIYKNTNMVIDSIAKCHNLEELYLVHSGIKNDELESLIDLKQLKKLTIRQQDYIREHGDADLNDIGLKHIGSCIKLKTLDLKGCRGITKEGISSLSNLTELEYLDLSECKFINNGSLKYLYSLKKLEVLDISGTDVNFMGVYCIKKQIPGLEVRTVKKIKPL